MSGGCDLCYAEELMDHRYRRVKWGPDGVRVRTSESNWNMPRRLQARAERDGTRPKVFCASLADVFDTMAPPGALADLWRLIHATPSLDWLLLTKRPQRIADCLPGPIPLAGVQWRGDESQHVWLGVSTEDQKTYDLRWPVLARFQESPVLWLSVEPMIGPIDLTTQPVMPDWVIIAGESGTGARRMERVWVDDLISQCRARGIPVWFKQWGTAYTHTRDPLKGGELVDGVRVHEDPVPALNR